MLRRLVDGAGRRVLALIALAGVTAIGALVALRDGDLGTEAALAALPPEAALEHLAALPRPMPPQLTYLYAQLLAEDGQGPRAETVLTDLADRAGPTQAVLTALADLALRRGDAARALDLLGRADAVQADADRLHRRAALARDLGRDADERVLLQAIGANALAPHEALRLADLLAWAGDAAAVEALAQARIRRGETDAPPMAQRLALSTLGRDAPQVLAGAIAGWPAGPAGESLLTAAMPALAARPRAAGDVARQVSAADPDRRLALIRAMSRAGLGAAVRDVMADHMALHDRPGPAEWEALTLHADRTGDLSFLERYIGSTPAAEVPVSALVPLVRYRGVGALAGHRAVVGDGARLASVPVIAAAWQLWQQRPDLALAALAEGARRGPPEDEAEARLWRSLARQLEPWGLWDRLRAQAQDDPALAAWMGESEG